MSSIVYYVNTRNIDRHLIQFSKIFETQKLYKISRLHSLFKWNISTVYYSKTESIDQKQLKRKSEALHILLL